MEVEQTLDMSVSLARRTASVIWTGILLRCGLRALSLRPEGRGLLALPLRCCSSRPGRRMAAEAAGCGVGRDGIAG